MKFLRQDRIGISIIRKSSPFVLFVAMLMIAAILQGCDKLGLTQNTNAATESNSGTQPWAASALKTPTRPPSTNTPTPSSTPTETPTVTPTQTPSPTPTPEIPFLITQFSLNPDRQYTFVITENGTRYLRDEHNQALMLKYIVVKEAGQPIGEWVDTSLEEKYAHLVPIDQPLLTLRFPGYGYNDCVNQYFDENYSNLVIVVWSTGNVRTQTRYDQNLNRNITTITGTAVYRDLRGNLQPLEVQYVLMNASSSHLSFGLCMSDSFEEIRTDRHYCPTSGGIRPPLAVVEELISRPGQMLRVQITDQRPDNPPSECLYPNGSGDTNINSLGTYFMPNRDLWLPMVESILQTGINPHPEIIVGATNFYIYTTHEEQQYLWDLYPITPP